MEYRIILALAALVLSSGCLGPFMPEKGEYAPSKSDSTTTITGKPGSMTSLDPGLGLEDVKKLIDAGEGYACTYRISDVDEQLWYQDGKWLTKASMLGFDAYILYDGVYGYMWNGMMSTGTKFRAFSMETPDPIEGEDKYLNIEYVYGNAEDVRCIKAENVTGLLSPPEEIEFMEAAVGG